MSNDIIHPKVIAVSLGVILLAIVVIQVWLSKVLSEEFKMILLTIISMSSIIWGSLIRIKGE